ncbi:unnamed protein product [Cladocopium goreaui]|uniref:Serine/threonine-protein kinase 33 n=1 Tax=Cladocopium goreaui TaxID=2562237 RepID=A0A9P1CIK8_9DINO|nr:unnamed protein product [Cladocopium goreaui]
MAMGEADVEGEAVDDFEHMKTYGLRFIPAQIIICVLLWLIGAIYMAVTANENIFLAKGGLDTFANGWTSVRTHKDCEDCAAGGKASGIQLRRFIRAVAEVLEFEMNTSEALKLVLGPVGLNAWLMADDLRWQAIWRLITYQFTHGHFTHIAMNTLVALFTGIPLEGFHGPKRTFIVFETSVICGGLWHMAWRPHDSALVGMSAGCYALMAMHMADLIMNWGQNRYRFPRLFLLLLLIGLDVGAGAMAKPDDVTGHAAHFGGYLAGLIFGLCFVRNVKVTKCEKYLQAVGVFIGCGCLIFCLVWIALWAPRSLWDGGVPWCWARQVRESLRTELSNRCRQSLCF